MLLLLLVLEGLVGIRADCRPGAVLGLHVQVLLARLLAAKVMVVPGSSDRGTGGPVVEQLIGGVAQPQAGVVAGIGWRTAGQKVEGAVGGTRICAGIPIILPKSGLSQYIILAFVERLGLPLAPQGPGTTATGHLGRQGGIGIGAQTLLQGIAGEEQLLLLVKRIRPLRFGGIQLIHFVLGYIDLFQLGRRGCHNGCAGRGRGHQIGLLLLRFEASVMSTWWSRVHPGRLIVIALVIVVIAAARVGFCRIAVLVELDIGHHIGGGIGSAAVVKGGRRWPARGRGCSMGGTLECGAGDFRIIGHIQGRESAMGGRGGMATV